MIKKICFFTLAVCLLTGCSTARQTYKPSSAQTVSRLTNAEDQQFYYHYYEALRLRDNKKYDQALEKLLFCYEIDSLNPGLNADLGMMFTSLGFIPEAKRYFEKAVELEPSNWWYNIRLINMLSELKEHERAIELTTELQKKYPYKEDVYYMLATLYTDTRQYDKAIKVYDRLEKIVGINESLSFEKFRLYVLDKKGKKGIAEIDKLIEEYPAENRFRVLRGDIYMQQNMPEKALEIYQQVLKKDPQNAYAYISLSEYYNSTNQPEKAVESIVNALKNEQLDIQTKMEILGRYIDGLLSDEKKIDETEDLFKLLIDRYPLEEQAHAYYAIFLQYQERYDEMLDELETILYINPKNEGAWFQIIQSAFVDQDFEKAIALTTRAISNVPENPNFYFYKTIALVQQKDYISALEIAEEGLKLFDQTSSKVLQSDFYSQQGDIYYQLNEKEKAFEAYENALKANPGNIYTMNNYAYFLSLEKENLRRAERLSAKTVELEPKNSTYLDTYAWILYQQGSYSLAKFYIERAIDNLDPATEPGVIYDHYGDILWMNGQHEKAVEMWEKAAVSGLDDETLKQKIETKSLNQE